MACLAGLRQNQNLRPALCVTLVASLVQALILAPTHEIALQSAEVLGQLAAHMPAPGAAIGIFIGGLPISEDQKLLRRCSARRAACDMSP